MTSQETAPVAVPFASSREHLLAEIERIDLLIQAAVRAKGENGGTERSMEALLAPGHRQNQAFPRARMERHLTIAAGIIAERKQSSGAAGIDFALERVRRSCKLSDFDVEVLIVCILSALDARYEVVFGYLSNGLGPRAISVDLIANLLCVSFEQKMNAAAILGPGSPLIRYGLLHMRSVTGGPVSVTLDDRVLRYLLGSEQIEPPLSRYAEMLTPLESIEQLDWPESSREKLANLLRHTGENSGPTLLYLEGRRGAGKRSAACAVANSLGKRLLVVRLEDVDLTDARIFEEALELAAREAHLQDTAILCEGVDLLASDEKRLQRSLLLSTLHSATEVLLLSAEESAGYQHYWSQSGSLRFILPRLTHAGRVRVWEQECMLPLEDVHGLASRFQFTRGQIRNAAEAALRLAAIRGLPATTEDFQEACQLENGSRLPLGLNRVIPKSRWEDLVLPPGPESQLREIACYFRYRPVVLEDWGFGRKISLGKGLNAMFSGPPGTGKTMAAEVLAHTLGLDLLRVDLSLVLSKFIGETEKALSRIFNEAEHSAAILFFDEADALFGKRTEVKDSHDRYANIEAGYLLQRIEQYEGVVILATNFCKNIDEAFVRRMHFRVEFPFPDEKERRRIWEAIWPLETPLGPDVDSASLAHQFELSGGSIRNIALRSAYLAAGENQPVGMTHLARAARREYENMGKLMAGTRERHERKSA